MIRRIFYLSLIAYFGFITFLAASKLHSVIFVTILIIGVVLIYRKHVVSWKASLFIVILLLAVGISVTKSEINERFAHIHNFTVPDFNAPDNEFNELTLRLAIFKCAIYIIKENPIFGTGVGDVMADLESVYRKVDFKFGYNNAYDPHNQYLRVCLSTGIVGLSLFLMSLIVVLIRSFQSGDWLVVGFIILFCIAFLFESILERHNGIIPYAFFYSVLIFGINNNIKPNTRRDPT
jgi:O-antigen ligase